MSHRHSSSDRRPKIDRISSSEKKVVAKSTEGGITSFLSDHSNIIIFGLSVIIIFLLVIFFMYKRGSDDHVNELIKKSKELEESNEKMSQYIEQMQSYLQVVQQPVQMHKHQSESVEKESEEEITDVEEPERELIDVDSVTNALRKPEEVED